MVPDVNETWCRHWTHWRRRWPHQFICSGVPASGTNEPVRPTARCQILLAGFLRGEVGLKLMQRLGKRWPSHAHTLPVVGLLKQPDNQKRARVWAATELVRRYSAVRCCATASPRIG